MLTVRKGAGLILLDPPSITGTCEVCDRSPTTLLALVWGESPGSVRWVIEACYFCPKHLNQAQRALAALQEKYRV